MDDPAVDDLDSLIMNRNKLAFIKKRVGERKLLFGSPCIALPRGYQALSSLLTYLYPPVWECRPLESLRGQENAVRDGARCPFVMQESFSTVVRCFGSRIYLYTRRIGDRYQFFVVVEAAIFPVSNPARCKARREVKRKTNAGCKGHTYVRLFSFIPLVVPSFFASVSSWTKWPI
jgi:hypothetical protein